MVRFLKVIGDSMTPEYKEGDFVITIAPPFLFQFLKAGDVIAFAHGNYGLLIKRIRELDRDSKEVSVEGTQENSLDSRRLGPIRKTAVIGKVIAHFPKP
jgi:signal peptidase I